MYVSYNTVKEMGEVGGGMGKYMGSGEARDRPIRGGWGWPNRDLLV